MKRTLTVEEKTAERAETKRRKIEEEDRLIREKWRFVDPHNECFLLDQLPPEQSFLQVDIRPTSSLKAFDIFFHFIDQNVINLVKADHEERYFNLGHRSDGRGEHRVEITSKLIWQSIAVQVWLTGEQERAKESNPSPNFLSNRIQMAREFFVAVTGHRPYSRNALERAVAQCLLTDKHSSIISDNFCSIVVSLGQYLSGDEKLFRFTGKSSDIRLVISKPDRIGLWFYELCGVFQNGLPYLLDVFLHQNATGTVTVESVVGRWLKVLKKENLNINKKCFLSADSYYLDNSVRNLMMKPENLQLKFSFSLKADRMKPEKRMVHPLDEECTQGEFKAIDNDHTGEGFVYHYDTQKGVGIKYNYSRGFLRSTEKRIVKEKKESKSVPFYEYYKHFFECCDRFNRRLCDCTFPHKRGGKGRLGDVGRHNDFLMAVVLQNTRNTYMNLKNLDNRTCSFKTFCEELALDIFMHSMKH